MQLTERPIAIFDLDGVIIRNPESALSGPPITNNEYWEHHWTNPDYGLIQHEVVSMMHALQAMGYHLVVLTARPVFFQAPTKALLEHCKFNPILWETEEQFADAFAPREFTMRDVTLKMFDGHAVPHSSKNWKADIVQFMLESDLNVQFMMEDYKPNADAVRKHVPVLLYERRK